MCRGRWPAIQVSSGVEYWPRELEHARVYCRRIRESVPKMKRGVIWTHLCPYRAQVFPIILFTVSRELKSGFGLVVCPGGREV